MMQLDGKLVVITGAARGIGAEAAREFVAAGARVALISRSAEALAALAAELGADKAVALTADVADADSLAGAIAKAEAAFGPVEVLINNAGVVEPIGHLSTLDPAAFQQAIAINLNGVFYGMRAVLPGMIARGRGTILTVGSGAAHNPQEGWGAYCSSKAGAYMLTRAAHHEAGAKGVRVSSLSPGTVATSMQKVIKASGVNPISQLEWTDHIPADWPAKALLWMCGPAGAEFAGKEVSLRDEGIRRAIGLIQ